MQSAMPPVIERIIVLKHAPLSAADFNRSLERWDTLIAGQLTRQDPPKTRWNIEIPSRADGAPEIDNMSVKCDVTHQYWSKIDGSNKICVQVRPEVVTFNLVSGKDGAGSYDAISQFARDYLPLWQEAADLKDFSGAQLQYLNIFRPEHYAPFIENNKIQLNRVIRVFVGTFGDASYVVPYKHEFTIDWQQRKGKCLLDVGLSMPNKNPVQLDLKITARTGGSESKLTGKECLEEIIPAYHEYALEIFNAMVTDDAQAHCRITR